MTQTQKDPPRPHLTDEDRKNIRLCERHQHRPVTPEARYRSLLEAGELHAASRSSPTTTMSSLEDDYRTVFSSSHVWH